MPSSLNFVVKIQILNSERSWADDGHIALENVDQFGQLVQRGAAQKSAVFIEPDVVRKQVAVLVLRVAHGAELEQFEDFSLPSFPFLPGRGCTKKGLPRIAMAPMTARISNTGESTMIAAKDKEKSSNLLKNLGYMIDTPRKFTQSSF